MSVNVSMRQLDSNTFVDDVAARSRPAASTRARSIIEITESVLMKDANATVARLHRLKDLGVQLAIDDFGTGYSSLAYLRQFPIDVLKIDRSFVVGDERVARAAALIHTLVELGHTLGLSTLAEGIDRPLRSTGCAPSTATTARGTCFSRPVAAADIEQPARPGRPRRRAPGHRPDPGPGAYT